MEREGKSFVGEEGSRLMSVFLATLSETISKIDPRGFDIQTKTFFSEDSDECVVRLFYKKYYLKIYLNPVYDSNEFLKTYITYSHRLFLTDYGILEHNPEDYEIHGQGD